MKVHPKLRGDAKIMEQASIELKNANLLAIFSYRYAFLLGWKAGIRYKEEEKGNGFNSEGH